MYGRLPGRAAGEGCQRMTADGGARDACPMPERRPRGDRFYAGQIDPRDDECVSCGNQACTNHGHYMSNNRDSVIAVCPRCNRPTFVEGKEERRYPSSAPGQPVTGVRAEPADLSDEARYAAGAGAYPAAVVACRKMPMNIAVNEEAEPGLGFKQYVDYLGSRRLCSPKVGAFVGYVRDRGTDANHEIEPMTEQDAIAAVEFVGALIRRTYEVPSKLPVAQPKVGGAR